MKEKEFNLIDEPWIKVMLLDNTSREVSLKEVLIHSHEYKMLAGEMALQDIAVMRFLLAVVHTVFSRMDAEGNQKTIQDIDEAIGRWEELWYNGSFPEKPVLEYLEEWRERLWLFHPERPFYQAPGALEGTRYEVSKLIGELSESSNKAKIFSPRTAEEKESLKYGEAARWLLFINGFDDTSAKKPAPKTGWLGKCGLIYAVGDNLFETLMLNMVFLQDAEKCWSPARPYWEKTVLDDTLKKEISVPDNQAELLSLQSRKLFLERQNGKVTGYYLQAGDYFEEKDAFAEQMTTWVRSKEKKGEKPYYSPDRCGDASRQMWRDFANDFIPDNQEGHRIPGVVAWIYLLKKTTKCIERKRMIGFRKMSALYKKSGIPDSAIEDMYGDRLTFHTSLMTEAGKLWQNLIADEIQKIDKMAGYAGYFAQDLIIAARGYGEKDKTDFRKKAVGEAKAELYYRIDAPFRKWMESVNPEDKGMKRGEKIREWHEIARKTGVIWGKEQIEKAGAAAFKGRSVSKDKEGSKKEYYCAPKAFNKYMAQISGLYPRKEEANEKDG